MIVKQLAIYLLICLFIAGCDNGDKPKQQAENKGTSITLQNKIYDILTTDVNDYTKTYTYISDKNQTLTLSITNIQGPRGGTLSALKSELKTYEGREIEFGDIGHNNTIWADIDLSSGETLNITLSSFGTFRDEFYEYEIVLLPSASTDLIIDGVTLEPNNTKNIATEIELNNLISSELLVGSTDQSDTFRINLEDGVKYTLSALNVQGKSSSTIGGLRFELNDSNNNPTMTVFDLKQAIGSNLEFTPKSAGAHYLTVFSPPGTIYQNEFYSYEFTIWEPRGHWDNPYSGDYFEPNETAALAYEIDVSQEISSDLKVGPRDFADSYALKIYPGNNYSVSITATDGPNRSALSNLRFIVTDQSGKLFLSPEQRISVGQKKVVELSTSSITSAIIKLYYMPTSGHERDYHAYSIVADVI